MGPQPRKTQLTFFSRSEHSSKNFECTTCNKTFVSVSKLEEHSTVHSGDRSFPCLTCGKAFSRSYHLKVHTRIHTGEKPYKCGQCEKTFIDSSALRGHMKSHNEDKPFECSICSRQFKDKGNLKQHESTHKGEKPHECPVCGQAFAFKRNMLRHTETHEGAVNDFLSDPDTSQTTQMLSSGSTMQVLLKKKENEAGPHACPECGVKFVNLKTLRHHCKTCHSTLGTFQCSLCSKSWRNECDLRKHMK